MSITSIVTVIVIGIGLFIEIIPVKISPLAWIGKHLNRDINTKVEHLETEICDMKKEQVYTDAMNMRTQILDFSNSCRIKQKHTKEEFDHVLDTIGRYEKYMEDHKIPNGVIKEACKYIRETNDKCWKEDSYL